MLQYTENKTIKFSKKQIESLNKLKQYDVNVAEFIRQAIREKIQRDWPEIKNTKEKQYIPF